MKATRLPMRLNRRPRTVHVFADGYLLFNGRRIACSLGSGGVVATKIEGDGGTPSGLFPVRRLWFRSDRVHVQTAIPCQPILRTHGWCDDPASGLYNRPFRLPAHVSHERLYRRDRLYDLVLTIGHNDSPARAGGGSAIFVHVQPENDAATAGCIAPSRDDLIWLLARLRPGDMFRVHPPGSGSVRFPPRRVLP